MTNFDQVLKAQLQTVPPGEHPDADQLAALTSLEGERRAALMEHLSRCTECRQVAFAAVASVRRQPSRLTRFAALATAAAIAFTIWIATGPPLQEDSVVLRVPPVKIFIPPPTPKVAVAKPKVKAFRPAEPPPIATFTPPMPQPVRIPMGNSFLGGTSPIPADIKKTTVISLDEVEVETNKGEHWTSHDGGATWNLREPQ